MEDKVGRGTLDVIGAADKFNRWMFQTIQSFAQGDILEIGSGIGNISTHFLDNEYSIMLSDFRPEYCEELTNKFSHFSNFLGVRRIDLVDPNFSEKHQELLEKFDTVFALNVIEHIEDDKLAIANCKKFLRKGGNLIILVPSYQSLFNNFDFQLGHYRRYNIPKLINLFRKNDLEIIHQQYFNSIGTLGWLVNGTFLKKKSIPEGQMILYNKLVPVFKILDRAFLNKFGLSTIVIGTKTF